MTAIRRPILADVPSLVDLELEVHRIHLAAAPGSYLDPSREQVAARFRELLTDPSVQVLVADVAGDVVGHVVVRRVDRPGNILVPPRRTAHVDELGVRADVRRKGHGRALMAAAEECARAWGADAVSLDIQAFNKGALRFYEALGYAVASTRMARPLDTGELG